MRPENGEAAPAPWEKGRRTKLVRVKQGYIDCLLREPAPKVFDGVPEEIIDNLPDVLREQLRAAQQETRAYMQRLVDKDIDVLEQYRAKGCAMEEVEVYDEGEEEVEVYDDEDDEEEEEVEDDEEEEEVEVYDIDEEEDGCGDDEAAKGGAKAGGVTARVGACRL